MNDLALIARSRDTSALEAGQRVIWRKRGTANMYAGTIEVVDNQRPFPLQVMLDNGCPIEALCDEIVVFPLITPDQVDAFLNDD